MTMFFKHVLSLIIYLRCSYNNLLGPGADKLLQLMIACMNSSSKKFDYIDKENESSLSLIQLLHFHEVFQVFMVHPDLELELHAL